MQLMAYSSFSFMLELGGRTDEVFTTKIIPTQMAQPLGIPRAVYLASFDDGCRSEGNCCSSRQEESELHSVTNVV